MSLSEVQVVPFDVAEPRLVPAAPAKKARSGADSTSTDEAELAWSSSTSVASQEEDAESTCGSTEHDGDEQDEYYAFLRDFAGSYDAGGEEEEEEDEQGDHDSASSASEEEDPLSEEEDETAAFARLARVHVDDGYDVVDAVRHYAQQRAGSCRQQHCEDLKAALRLRWMQAHKLGTSAATQQSEPQVRAHYKRIRINLLMEAKAIEHRLVRSMGMPRVASA